MTDTTNTETETTVTLVGGPADWRGQTHLTSPDSTGTYLISMCTPDREDWEDLDPRAVYTPRPGAPHLWDFQGWFPSSQHDPEPADYDRVDLDTLRRALILAGANSPRFRYAIHTRLVGIVADLDDLPPAERLTEMATAISDEADLLYQRMPRPTAEIIARTMADAIWPSQH